MTGGTQYHMNMPGSQHSKDPVAAFSWLFAGEQWLPVKCKFLNEDGHGDPHQDPCVWCLIVAMGTELRNHRATLDRAQWLTELASTGVQTMLQARTRMDQLEGRVDTLEGGPRKGPKFQVLIRCTRCEEVVEAYGEEPYDHLEFGEHLHYDNVSCPNCEANLIELVPTAGVGPIKLPPVPDIPKKTSPRSIRLRNSIDTILALATEVVEDWSDDEKDALKLVQEALAGGRITYSPAGE